MGDHCLPVCHRADGSGQLHEAPARDTRPADVVVRRADRQDGRDATGERATVISKFETRHQ